MSACAKVRQKRKIFTNTALLAIVRVFVCVQIAETASVTAFGLVWLWMFLTINIVALYRSGTLSKNLLHFFSKKNLLHFLFSKKALVSTVASYSFEIHSYPIFPRIGLNVLRWVLNEATTRFSRGGREAMDKFFPGGSKKKKVRLCIYADSSDILAL